MVEANKRKTTFITPWETYCYKVMPFGLKNAGATYQRAMVALFNDMMHKEIEVYVDDMIAKSKDEESHTPALRKLFERLRKYQLKLNPAKCTFGVKSGKLLGFVVSNKGIEVDPDKVKAIQDMPAPKTEKEVRGFLGRNESRRKEQAIYYLSKKFTECESRYSMVEKLCCSLVWSAKRLRQYILYYTTWLISRMDPLKFIFEKPYMLSRIARWQVLLAEYDIIYMTRKSVKGSAIVDHLADNAIEDYKPLNFDFPDEDVLVTENEEKSGWWAMYFDGAVNVSGNGARALIISPEGKQYPISVKGEWQTRDEKLRPYQEYLSKLAESFDEIEFTHLRRDKNQFVDALATLASMAIIDCGAKIQPVSIEIRNSPSHCCLIEEETNKDPWYMDIKRFIRHQEYPSGASKIDKRNLRRMAMEYYIDGEILYKRSFDGTLLRCLSDLEANMALQEVHGRICATHTNGHMMARHMQRAVYSDKVNAPPTPLFNMVSPWPFAMWGIDVIGPINPKASNGHRFILVVIDYFTKWVKAYLYAHVTQKVVKRFIEKDLICRYGVPERVVIDNAQNFNEKMIAEICTKWKIKHSNSSPYRPKMNGTVEAANKNIKKIVQKMVITYKDWHEWLPYALHAYRIAVRTSTGATPYSLGYGMEAVVPLEVEIPSLRVLMESGLEESDWVKLRYKQLNMISERRLAAICHHQLYQRRMAKAYDRKVQPRELKKGDLVLRKVLSLPGEDRSKWTPNYEGPYVVKKAFSGGALILTRMDGEDVVRPVNSDSIKKYYP
nr:uncharacterized protein LOC118030069 [Populus alba]